MVLLTGASGYSCSRPSVCGRLLRDGAVSELPIVGGDYRIRIVGLAPGYSCAAVGTVNVETDT